MDSIIIWGKIIEAPHATKFMLGILQGLFTHVATCNLCNDAKKSVLSPILQMLKLRLGADKSLSKSYSDRHRRDSNCFGSNRTLKPLVCSRTAPCLILALSKPDGCNRCCYWFGWHWLLLLPGVGCVERETFSVHMKPTLRPILFQASSHLFCSFLKQLDRDSPWAPSPYPVPGRCPALHKCAHNWAEIKS